MASCAATVFHTSTEEAGFQEQKREHDRKEDECGDPNALSHSNSIGQCFDISERYQSLINRIFARGVEL